MGDEPQGRSGGESARRKPPFTEAEMQHYRDACQNLDELQRLLEHDTLLADILQWDPGRNLQFGMRLSDMLKEVHRIGQAANPERDEPDDDTDAP